MHLQGLILAEDLHICIQKWSPSSSPRDCHPPPAQQRALVMEVPISHSSLAQHSHHLSSMLATPSRMPRTPWQFRAQPKANEVR